MDIDTDNIMNNEGTNILIRDFVGMDFTSWVYDLFRPNEPYTNRGIHPSGVGIKRYIKTSDLTKEEQSYLKLQGFLSLFNFISQKKLQLIECKE